MSADRDWLHRFPKVELHLHLEGAIPLTALWQLITKYGGDPTAPSPEHLAARFVYQDFPHFLELWEWKNRYLREYEDFSFAAQAVAENLAEQNIRYAEVFFSPGDFSRFGLETQPLTAAIREGLNRVPAIEIGLVADLVRDFGPVAGAAMLQRLAEVRDLGVIGIGIGGSEHQVPPGRFRQVYERAREIGFKTSAHAGEAAGAASVWEALTQLRVDRIGHATRAREDPALVDYLAEHAVPLELCPLSNVKTGVVGAVRDHPARLYFDRGIPVSINSDDPAMFGTTLVAEFLSLIEEQGFTRAEVKRLTIAAAESSWLPDRRKQKLVDEIAATTTGDPDGGKR